MYLQHYNLSQIPFRNTPDPKFFFETPRHNEALANLIYAVEQRRGFVLLSGEIGSGKTLVTHMLLRHLEDHAQIALVRNTHLNSSQLIRILCDEFSVQVPDGPDKNDKATMLLAINQFLIQQLAEDRLVVVIIDEAQNLSDKVLEELRMLSNLETSSDKLLQIVLVGQPELRDKVSQPHLEQLRQRIALSYHLEPLTFEETKAYIEHRLVVAQAEGGHKAAFTPEAIAKIARFSRGTPRIINGICDNCLLYGFTGRTTTIDEKIVDKVLKHSMHLVPKSHTPTRSPFGGENLNPAPAGGAQPRPQTPVAPPIQVAAVETPPPPGQAVERSAGVEDEESKKKSSPPASLPFPTLRPKPPRNLAQ
jgi:general secretion pathway protein A